MISSVERLFTVPVQRDPLGVQRRPADMNSGSGTDNGTVLAMLQDLMAMQRDIRLELAELRTEVRRQAARMDELAGRLNSPPQAAVPRISAMEARIRRIERHLDLPPIK
ncbi:MAG TPA: hypothetical protein VLI93_17425 [Acetobacteraceae bacterium]|nr:hypothetical protein [Acetobacteraceae bacterium]